MNANTILDELKSLGRGNYKNVLLKHGVREPCLGVKIADLKKIQKRGAIGKKRKTAKC